MVQRSFCAPARSAFRWPYQARFRLKGEAEPEALAPHGDERQKHSNAGSGRPPAAKRE
jgi:hypothetical protein